MRALICTSLFACLALVACAAQDKSADQADASDVSSADADAPDAAVSTPDAGESADASNDPRPPLPRYSVPVEDGSELEQFSFYPVAIATGEIRRGTLKIEYPFPVFLSGVKAAIELEGPYQPGQTHVVVTAAQYGQGECDLTDGVWVCTEQLPGIQVDREAAKAAMAAAGVAATEITRRLEVTDRFSIDPIGIFELDASVVEIRDDED